MRMLSYSSRLE